MFSRVGNRFDLNTQSGQISRPRAYNTSLDISQEAFSHKSASIEKGDYTRVSIKAGSHQYFRQLQQQLLINSECPKETSKRPLSTLPRKMMIIMIK